MPMWQEKWKDHMMENLKYQGFFFEWKVVTWRCSWSCQKASSAWFPWAIVISSCYLILDICFIVDTCLEPGPITWVPYATSRDECSRTEHAYRSHPRNGGLRETNSPPIDFLTNKTDPFTSSVGCLSFPFSRQRNRKKKPFFPQELKVHSLLQPTGCFTH